MLAHLCVLRNTLAGSKPVVSAVGTRVSLEQETMPIAVYNGCSHTASTPFFLGVASLDSVESGTTLSSNSNRHEYNRYIGNTFGADFGDSIIGQPPSDCSLLRLHPDSHLSDGACNSGSGPNQSPPCDAVPSLLGPWDVDDDGCDSDALTICRATSASESLKGDCVSEPDKTLLGLRLAQQGFPAVCQLHLLTRVIPITELDSSDD